MLVNVTRYDLRRLRLGQALVPAAIVMTIVWRHNPGPPTLAVAVALLASALVSLLLARRSPGQADLLIEHNTQDRVAKERPADFETRLRAAYGGSKDVTLYYGTFPPGGCL